MALLTGEKVKVPFEFQDREETLYLNENSVYGRSEQIQNDPLSFETNRNSTGTNDVNITDDFVLTEVIISSAYNNPVADYMFITISIKGNIIFNGYVTGLYYVKISIPNWLIRTDESVRVIFAETGGSYASVSFIGFKT